MSNRYKILTLVLVLILAVVAVVAVMGLNSGGETTAQIYNLDKNLGTINSEANAIDVAENVAGYNWAEKGLTPKPSLEGATKLNMSQYKEYLKERGVITSELALNNDGSDLSVWVVTFKGTFSPQKCPSGIVLPGYSKIEFQIDSRDGSVIGIQMK